MSTELSTGDKLSFLLSGIVSGARAAFLFEITSHLWFTTFGVVRKAQPCRVWLSRRKNRGTERSRTLPTPTLDCSNTVEEVTKHA
jgi:hypothetical protein